MTSDDKNQNDIINSELINSYKIDYIFSDKPINRYKIKPKVEDKSILLKKLKQEIENIKDCELKDSAKKIVFSDGNNQSKVMIVGEGPGQKEDEMGKPFVGDAGMLLNKMLNAIKIKREKIYITNVVNYRPPENRRPTEKEVERYLPYLKKHIEIIKPKIILLLGSTAMNAILKNADVISKMRGKWHEIEINNLKIYSIISFHPAYLLRQPDQKKFSWIDLKMIREKLKKF